jgi:hypothetical protein
LELPGNTSSKRPAGGGVVEEQCQSARRVGRLGVCHELEQVVMPVEVGIVVGVVRTSGAEVLPLPFVRQAVVVAVGQHREQHRRADRFAAQGRR